MARLMGAHVAMVNAVGDDGYGEQTLANFARYGIDTTARADACPGSSGVAPDLGRGRRQQPHHHHPGRQPTACCPEHARRRPCAPQARLDAVIGQFEIEQAVTAAAFRRGA